jgi:DNA-binding winged helix-turn-helix (wHTH) protein
MSEPEHTPRVLRFGVFELDRTAGEVRKQGRLVALTGQPLRVLDLLASNAGHVVTRDELQRAIWGDDTHVDFEAGLSTCINQVRSALGDRAASPRFVETLPRRGFRFVAPVEAAATNDVVRRHTRRYWPSVAGVAAMVAVTVVALTWPAPQARPLPNAAGVPAGSVAVRPIPVVVLPVMLDKRLSKMEPLAASLTEALTGALVTEAGPILKVASPVAVQHLRGPSLNLDHIRDVGAEYFITVKLAPLGRRINVHAKVSTIQGWMLWSTDRVLSAVDLGREQLSLSAELVWYLPARNPGKLDEDHSAGGVCGRRWTSRPRLTPASNLLV